MLLHNHKPGSGLSTITSWGQVFQNHIPFLSSSSEYGVRSFIITQIHDWQRNARFAPAVDIVSEMILQDARRIQALGKITSRGQVFQNHIPFLSSSSQNTQNTEYGVRSFIITQIHDWQRNARFAPAVDIVSEMILQDARRIQALGNDMALPVNPTENWDGRHP